MTFFTGDSGLLRLALLAPLTLRTRRRRFFVGSTVDLQVATWEHPPLEGHCAASRVHQLAYLQSGICHLCLNLHSSHSTPELAGNGL